jgi:hypothetical protein
MYPTYASFIVPAFYPANAKARSPYQTLEKAGVEAWPLGPRTSYFNSEQPRIFVIHSSEDDLLNVEYNAEGVKMLKEKGLSPIVDTTTFKVSYYRCCNESHSQVSLLRETMITCCTRLHSGSVL